MKTDYGTSISGNLNGGGKRNAVYIFFNTGRPGPAPSSAHFGQNARVSTAVNRAGAIQVHPSGYRHRTGQIKFRGISDINVVATTSTKIHGGIRIAISVGRRTYITGNGPVVIITA